MRLIFCLFSWVVHELRNYQSHLSSQIRESHRFDMVRRQSVPMRVLLGLFVLLATVVIADGTLHEYFQRLEPSSVDAGIQHAPLAKRLFRLVVLSRCNRRDHSAPARGADSDHTESYRGA